MRPIKFKAWDKKEKKMRFVLSIEWDTDQPGMLKSVDTYALRHLNPEDVILLQFAGIMDKNGVDIYEGDILDTIPDSDSFYPNRVVVEVHSMAFTFIGITPDASPYCKFTMHSITNKDAKNAGDLYVVGNIYENPDLLKSFAPVEGI